MTIYKAVRTEDGPVVTVHRDEQDTKGRALPHIFIHSAGGFEWGYGGSGPADLALAILAHHLGEQSRQVLAYWKRGLSGYRGKGSLAVDFHQDFKFATVARWPREGATITSNEVRTVLLQLREQRQKQEGQEWAGAPQGDGEVEWHNNNGDTYYLEAVPPTNTPDETKGDLQ